MITQCLHGAVWRSYARWKVAELSWIWSVQISLRQFPFWFNKVCLHLIFIARINRICWCVTVSVAFNEIRLACVSGVWSDAAPEPVAMATNRFCHYSDTTSFCPLSLFLENDSLFEYCIENISFTIKVLHPALNIIHYFQFIHSFTWNKK